MGKVPKPGPKTAAAANKPMRHNHNKPLAKQTLKKGIIGGGKHQATDVGPPLDAQTLRALRHRIVKVDSSLYPSNAYVTLHNPPAKLRTLDLPAAKHHYTVDTGWTDSPHSASHRDYIPVSPPIDSDTHSSVLVQKAHREYHNHTSQTIQQLLQGDPTKEVDSHNQRSTNSAPVQAHEITARYQALTQYGAHPITRQSFTTTPAISNSLGELFRSQAYLETPVSPQPSLHTRATQDIRSGQAESLPTFVNPFAPGPLIPVGNHQSETLSKTTVRLASGFTSPRSREAASEVLTSSAKPARKSLIVKLAIPTGYRLNEDMAPVRDPNNVHGAIKDVVQNLFNLQTQVHGFVPETQPLLVDKMTDLARSLAQVQTLTSPTKSPGNPIHQVRIAPEIIDYVDDGRNPDIFTRDFVELVNRGNSVINGKQQAFRDFSSVFANALKEGIDGVGEEVDQVMKNADLSEPKPKTKDVRENGIART